MDLTRWPSAAIMHVGGACARIWLGGVDESERRGGIFEPLVLERSTMDTQD